MFLLHIRLAAILLLFVFFADPAQAANVTATNSAFDALLSLPQTKPDEGEWNHVAPEGFDSADETDLIRWLVRQKKAGSDFNQTRHQGTMLHHAIRSGLETTARWLIANGADPLKTLDGGADQPDSLTLAIQYQRWTVIDTLLKLPKVTAPERSPQLLMAWNAPQSKDEQTAFKKLLARQMPLPKGKFGEQLLAIALERNAMKLVLALIDAGTVQVPSGSAGATYVPAIGNGGLASSDIEFADVHLANPIFPYLLAHLKSTHDVEALFKLRIRHPFNDADFTGLVVLRTLVSHTSPSVKRAVMTHIPSTNLKKSFENKEVIGSWVRWSSQLSGADGEWAFAMLGDLPIRQPGALLDGMLKDATWYDEHAKVPNLAAGWGRLLAHLHGPLPSTTSGKLWMFVPQQHRLSLLRLDYRPSTEELSDWLDRSDKEVIRAFWPELKSSIPEFIETIHESLLAPYSRDNDNNVCRWGSVGQQTLEKAHILIEDGAKPHTPVVLDAGCWSLHEATILQSLKTAGMIEAQSVSQVNRFVLKQPTCHFQANEVWRQALLKNAIGESSIDGVQTMSIPGQKQCALLTWGGDTGGRRTIDEDGFTGMQHFTPCTDGNSAGEVWTVIGNTLQKSDLGGVAIQGGDAVYDTHTHQHFLLVGGIGQGTCGTTPHQLLAVESKQGAASVLHVLPRKSEAMQALLSQCSTKGLSECFGEVESGDRSENTVDAFIDVHWKAERTTYIDAVLALNYETLNKITKNGIFPHWTTQAIDAVTKANLPLEDKRRRTAWLFRDAQQLARAAQSTDVLKGLIGWMPREDWSPIIKANQGNSWMLERLHDEADRQGKHTLACRFLTALKRTCSKVTKSQEMM